jgi:hypothetical protein
MLSGGISPSDCAKDVTESVVIKVTAPIAVSDNPHALKVHPKHQTEGKCRASWMISLKRSTYEWLAVMIDLMQDEPAWH